MKKKFLVIDMVERDSSVAYYFAEDINSVVIDIMVEIEREDFHIGHQISSRESFYNKAGQISCEEITVSNDHTYRIIPEENIKEFNK